MTTGAEYASITHKRLVGFQDFGERGIEYLRELCRQTLDSLYNHGSFVEKMTLDSVTANTVRLGLKPTELNGLVHDGNGHLLDIEQIMTAGYREDLFENNATFYEVGAGFVSRPSGIQINARTGLPEFIKRVEDIGDEADPDLVTDNGNGTITFRVDSLVEPAGGESFAGREVRVFKKVLAAGATTELEAIETLVVSYGGTNNTITTVGALGQSVISTVAADYTVQLVGLSIRRAGGSQPLSASDHHFIAGAVFGNGGTPVAFATATQAIINTANLTAIGARSPWADGTTNPADDLGDVLEKIITDLTSVTGGRGAAKLTAPAATGVGHSLVAGTLDNVLGQLLQKVNTEQLNRFIDAIVGDVRDSDTGAGDIPLALACFSRNMASAVPAAFTTMTLIAAVGDSMFKWSGNFGEVWHDVATAANLKAVLCHATGLNIHIVAVGDAGEWIARISNQSLGTINTFDNTLAGTPNMRQIVHDPFNTANAQAWAVGDRVYRVQWTTAVSAPTFSLVDSNAHVGAVPIPGRVVFYRPSDDRLYYCDSPFTTLVQGALVGMGIGSQPSSMIYDPDVGIIMTEDNSDTVYISVDGTAVASHTLFAGSPDSTMAFRFQGRTFMIAQEDLNLSGSVPFHGGATLYATKSGVFSTTIADWIAVPWPGPIFKGMPVAAGGASQVGQNWNFAACEGFVMGRTREQTGTYGSGRVSIGRRVVAVTAP